MDYRHPKVLPVEISGALHVRDADSDVVEADSLARRRLGWRRVARRCDGCQTLYQLSAIDPAKLVVLKEVRDDFFHGSLPPAFPDFTVDLLRIIHQRRPGFKVISSRAESTRLFWRRSF